MSSLSPLQAHACWDSLELRGARWNALPLAPAGARRLLLVSPSGDYVDGSMAPRSPITPHSANRLARTGARLIVGMCGRPLRAELPALRETNQNPPSSV